MQETKGRRRRRRSKEKLTGEEQMGLPDNQSKEGKFANSSQFCLLFLENCPRLRNPLQGKISSSSASSYSSSSSSSSSWVRDRASESGREEASAVEKTTIPRWKTSLAFRNTGSLGSWKRGKGVTIPLQNAFNFLWFFF